MNMNHGKFPPECHVNVLAKVPLEQKYYNIEKYNGNYYP